MKKKPTVTQLMYELENVEKSLKKLDRVDHIESSIKSKGKLKYDNKNKRNAIMSITSVIIVKKLIDKFIKFGQKITGRGIFMSKQKLGMNNLNIIMTYLVKNFCDIWIIDYWATNYVCYSLQWKKHI